MLDFFYFCFVHEPEDLLVRGCIFSNSNKSWKAGKYFVSSNCQFRKLRQEQWEESCSCPAAYLHTGLETWVPYDVKMYIKNCKSQRFEHCSPGPSRGGMVIHGTKCCPWNKLLSYSSWNNLPGVCRRGLPRRSFVELGQSD